jgi:hypothetical protein
MTYTYEPGRFANGSSRPIGSQASTGGWQRVRETLVFEEHELVFNPWEHLVDIPEAERTPFGFSRTFESSSYFTFHRDGREYSIHFMDLVDSGLPRTYPV